MSDNKLTVEEFRGRSASVDFACAPGVIDLSERASFLFQTGYLTLRPDDVEDYCKLDCPNREILAAMSLLMMDNILGGRTSSKKHARCLIKALGDADVGAVVAECSHVLSSLPHDDLIEALRKGHKLDVREYAIGEKAAKEAIGEWLCRSTIKTFLLSADLPVGPEDHGNLGRSDLEFTHGERTWIFDLKVPTKGQNAKKAAKAALARTTEKNRAAPHHKPLMVGLALSKAKRIITAWMV